MVYHVQHWTRQSEYLLRYVHVLCKAVGNAVAAHKCESDHDRDSGFLMGSHAGKDTVVVIEAWHVVYVQYILANPVSSYSWGVLYPLSLVVDVCEDHYVDIEQVCQQPDVEVGSPPCRASSMALRFDVAYSRQK